MTSPSRGASAQVVGVVQLEIKTWCAKSNGLVFCLLADNCCLQLKEKGLKALADGFRSCLSVVGYQFLILLSASHYYLSVSTTSNKRE